MVLKAPRSERSPVLRPLAFALPAVAALAVLAFISLLVGVSDVSVATIVRLFSHNEDDLATQVLVASRVPRTLALLLAGSAMAVAGLLMQMLARNHYVEPSTMGTAESAGMGMLVGVLLWPDMPVFAKMGLAAVFALAGTALFLAVLSRIRLRAALIVPLVGLVLSGVIESATTFIAYRFDLMQTARAWMTADFSAIVQGRYELLWLSLAVTIVAMVAADRFTVAGMGQDFATNLGLNYKRLVAQGVAVVSVVTASVIVTVGIIPFVGLIVPNLVRLVVGDNVRKSVLWVAWAGALMALACDLIGRLVIAPYEVPIGTVMGVIGSAMFLALLLARRKRVGG
ncbi:iron complex transport system permease protein [Comamonas odontotermitis]|uniref:Iron complex transport system permease protein n=2 Tax=Comamonas odontotermitis TaxID=379895 RepID=A0ABR6RC23_9BURK|nr:iron complex transport system permease protein [Comamonas odontotermitis]